MCLNLHIQTLTDDFYAALIASFSYLGNLSLLLGTPKTVDIFFFYKALPDVVPTNKSIFAK